MIVSDNAKQFGTANRIIHKLWNIATKDERVIEFTYNNAISWKYIPELTPWFGGFYERLVGVTKTSLKAAIDRRRLNLVELETIAAETATILNSRPLLYNEEVVGDHPLTPSHLTFTHHSVGIFYRGGVRQLCSNETNAR